MTTADFSLEITFRAKYLTSRLTWHNLKHVLHAVQDIMVDLNITTFGSRCIESLSVLGLGGIQIFISSDHFCIILGFMVLPEVHTSGAIKS